MLRALIRICVLLPVCSVLGGAQVKDVYFLMSVAPSPDTIVLRLTDSETIQHARRILDGTETRTTHVMGTVVKAPAFYNSPWRFHVDAGSVQPFQASAEVCDSSIAGIENNLDDVGAALLPLQQWCPWRSQLLREIEPPAGAEHALRNVSAASLSEIALAPESIAISYGSNFVPTSQAAPAGEMPLSLLGASVSIVDSAGKDSPASLIFIAPERVTYLVPAGLASGVADVRLTTGDGRKYSGQTRIEAVAPGLFAMGEPPGNFAAALLLRVRADGTQSTEPVSRMGSGGQVEPVPIRFGVGDDRLYLMVFGTGVRGRSSLDAVSAGIEGVTLPVLYAGAQGEFEGLDQINLALPRSLAGLGRKELRIEIRNEQRRMRSNPVQLVFME
jgi:uncharacterized protein (TIGR03437 family)